jgi:PAS domain S-box-containing protein
VSGDHAVERPGRDDREPEAAGPRRAAQHAHRGLWLTQGCLVTALTLVLVAAQAEPYRAYLTAAVAALIVAIGTTFSVRRTVRSDAGQTGARDIEAVEGGAATDAVTHRSEERFRALVQHSSDVILVLDASGVVRYHSPSLRDVLGDRAALVLGRLPLDVVAASHRQRMREAFERCRDAPDARWSSICRWRPHRTTATAHRTPSSRSR